MPQLRLAFSRVLPGALWGLLAWALLCEAFILLHGCASTNAVGMASDIEQRAYAVYGTFVVIEERGAQLVGDPNTPAAVKVVIRLADSKAKPSADALLKATQDYLSIAAQVKAGGSTPAALATATANLTGWITTATADVNNLVSAVKGGP
jgi:hypothetical protein